jgi:phage shock protein A
MVVQLGLAYEARQETGLARKLLTRAKHLDPSDRRIDQALQELSKPRKRLRSASRPRNSVR